MSTYFTDFEEYTTGVEPSDWTSRGAANDTWTVETTGSDKYLRCSDPDSFQFRAWDDVDADAERQDAEVLVKITRSGVSDNKPVCFARYTGSTASMTAYRCGGTADFFRLYKAVAATSFTSMASVSFTVADSVDFWIRFRVNGTTIQARIWEDGVSEPSAWTGTGTGWAAVTTTDSAVSGDGWVGIGATNSDSAVYDFWQVGIGTNGDTAPSSSAGAPSITALSAIGITATSAQPRISYS